jgi:hypothetical protein
MSASAQVSTIVDLEADTTYLILFYTDGNPYTMVDPEIDIRPLGDGELCETAVDISTGPFPYQLLGTFGHDPPVSPTCDDSPTNAVWYVFTPPISAWYDISCVNNTTTDAWSRLAVFFGEGCGPFGPELLCQMNAATTITAPLFMVEGNPYLMVFFTDGDAWTMVDPEITVSGP